MRTIKRHGFTLVELMIVICIIAILADILIPNFVRARAQGQYSACESNEKNEATGLEMYMVDHQSYPYLFSRLTPNYLKVVPTCPAAGTDTYTASYAAVDLGGGAAAGNPAVNYSFYCAGSYHTTLAGLSNFPQYNATQGLFTGQ